jgi:beta-glucosidase
VPLEDATYDLALAQIGRARVLLDGRCVLDGVVDPPEPGGTDMWGMASKDLVTTAHLEAGTPVEVEVEYFQPQATIAGVRVGFRTRDDDGLMERAVEAATGADAAIVFVGTSGEWETEGRDRADLSLPGRQEELVRRVAAANPSTVVVVNAAAPIDLSWADDVGAVLQCWFGGQEMGPALADVLTGAVEPGGRLATSVPVHLEHSPSHDNFPGENGELRYGESVFMGYRGFEHRRIEPRFPFGHGLGYTTFELGTPTLSSGTFRSGDALRVSVPITNTGTRSGSEVVQCYVAPTSPRLVRPPKELKAFQRVQLEPGESTVVELELDDRSFAYWDPGQADWPEISARAFSMFGAGDGPERRPPGWQVDPGSYDVLVGRSSTDLLAPVPVEIPGS